MIKNQINALTRHYNKKWNKGYKADLHLGTYEKSEITNKKDRCYKCRVTLYFYDTFEDNSDLMKKNIKPVCAKCLLKLDNEKNMLNSEQKEMISKYIENG